MYEDHQATHNPETTLAGSKRYGARSDQDDLFSDDQDAKKVVLKA